MQTSIEHTHNHTCGICHAHQTEINTCTTHCGHIYCLTCLVKHMEISYTCPICSAQLNQGNTADMENPPVASKYIGCIDEVAYILEDAGVKLLDVLIYYSRRYNSKTYPYWPRNRDCHLEHIERIEEIIDMAFQEVDKVDTIINENAK